MNLSVKFNLDNFLATTVGHATDLDNNEDEFKFYSELMSFKNANKHKLYSVSLVHRLN